MTVFGKLLTTCPANGSATLVLDESCKVTDLKIVHVKNIFKSNLPIGTLIVATQLPDNTFIITAAEA